MKKNNPTDKFYDAMMHLHEKFPNVETFAAALVDDDVAACAYGQKNNPPTHPLTALLSTEKGIYILMDALAGVPRLRARQIYELIGQMLGINYMEDLEDSGNIEDNLGDDEEEDMEGEEWKHSSANELCGTCKHFHETKCGFGKCKHHKGAFDGTLTTAQVTGNIGGCEHFEERGDFELS